MCPQGTTKRLSAARRGGCGVHAAAIDFFGTMTEHAHRSVRFEHDDEGAPLTRIVDYVPSRGELSDEERRALWFATSDDLGASFEEMLSANAASRSSVVRGVLSEQDRQRRRGACDETRLFFASSRRSEKSRREALRRGMEDANEVQLYQTDWLSLVEKSKPSKHAATTMSNSCGCIKVDGEDKRTVCSEEKTCSSKSCSNIDASSICALGGNEVACIDHEESCARKSCSQLIDAAIKKAAGISDEELFSMLSPSQNDNCSSTLPTSVLVQRKTRRSSGDKKTCTLKSCGQSSNASSERAVGLNPGDLSSMFPPSLTDDCSSTLPKSVVVQRKSRRPSGDKKKVGRRKRSSMPQTAQIPAAADAVTNEQAAPVPITGGALTSNNNGAAKKKRGGWGQ